MLEILKLLADIALKVIPGITKGRKDRQFNQIGADIFRIYTQINETLILGEIIADKVDSTLMRLNERVSTQGGNASISVDVHLPALVARQQQNLQVILFFLKKYSAQVQIIDAESYRRLTALLRGKLGVIGILGNVIRSDRFPIIEDYDEFLGILDSPKVLDSGGDGKFIRSLRAAIVEVPLEGRWTADMLPEIEAAIRKSQPRQQMGEIQEQLAALGKSLKDTFAISEILQISTNKDAYRSGFGELLLFVMSREKALAVIAGVSLPWQPIRTLDVSELGNSPGHIGGTSAQKLSGSVENCRDLKAGQTVCQAHRSRSETPQHKTRPTGQLVNLPLKCQMRCAAAAVNGSNRIVLRCSRSTGINALTCQDDRH